MAKQINYRELVECLELLHEHWVPSGGVINNVVPCETMLHEICHLIFLGQDRLVRPRTTDIERYVADQLPYDQPDDLLDNELNTLALSLIFMRRANLLKKKQEQIFLQKALKVSVPADMVEATAKVVLARTSKRKITSKVSKLADIIVNWSKGLEV